MGAPEQRVIAQMRRATLRVALFVAFANAAVLSVISLLGAGAGAQARTGLAAAVALAIAAWPLSRGEGLERHLSAAPWLSAVAAGLGGLMLAVDPTVRSTMFAAFLTPVGVCVLFAYWRQAVTATALLVGGYVIGSGNAGVHSSLGTTLSDTLAVFAVIAGGLLPARTAFATINDRRGSVRAWRETEPGAGHLPRPGRRGAAREHDQAILAGVAAGESDKMIALRLGFGPSVWRVRDRRHRLQREFGVANRRELAKLLHGSAGQPLR